MIKETVNQLVREKLREVGPSILIGFVFMLVIYVLAHYVPGDLHLTPWR